MRSIIRTVQGYWPFLSISEQTVGHGVSFVITLSLFQELATAGEQFDMVFIDADKNNYINYYKFIMDNNMLRLGGVICIDNSLFKARVYLNDTTDSNGLALREFNQFVSNDPRVEQVSSDVFMLQSVVCWLTFILIMPPCLKGHCPFKRRPHSYPSGTSGRWVLTASGTVNLPQSQLIYVPSLFTVSAIL